MQNIFSFVKNSLSLSLRGFEKSEAIYSIVDCFITFAHAVCLTLCALATAMTIKNHLVKTFLTSIKFTFNNLSEKITNFHFVMNKFYKKYIASDKNIISITIYYILSIITYNYLSNSEITSLNLIISLILMYLTAFVIFGIRNITAFYLIKFNLIMEKIIMKRQIFKTALVLIALATISTGCSKIKTFSLVGTYKSDSLIMRVGASGDVNFQKIDNSVTLEGAAATIADLSSYGSGGSPILTPWDLGDEKTSYTFDYTEKISTSSYDQNLGQMVYTYSHDLNWKFEFTKNKKTVNCKVTLNLPEDKGVSGSIDLSK